MSMEVASVTIMYNADFEKHFKMNVVVFLKIKTFTREGIKMF